jgi:hypothetical protein
MNHTAICIRLQIYVRENQSMKNATKKAGGAKKTAKKTASKKKGK